MPEITFPITVDDSSYQQVRQLLRDFSKVIRDTQRLLVCTANALHAQPATIPLFEALHQLDRSEGKQPDASQLEKSKEDAAFIAQEIERGFPFLSGQTMIAIWSQLEAFIEDLAVCFLSIAHASGILVAEPISKIKVPIGLFICLSESDRYRLIVETIQRDTSANLSRGINQFETLLERICLSGSIDESIKKLLFEISAMRNVLVHRRGIVDRRLAQECPWLRLQVGEPLKIPLTQILIYAHAVTYYGSLVYRRILVAIARPTSGLDRYSSELLDNLAGLLNMQKPETPAKE